MEGSGNTQKLSQLKNNSRRNFLSRNLIYVKVVSFDIAAAQGKSLFGSL
jgi:hypothetical protein